MSYQESSCTLEPNTIKRWLNISSNTLWFGALSFEDRATASIAWLAQEGLNINRAILLNYKSNVQPGLYAESKRENNFAILKQYEERVFKNSIEQQNIEPYAFNDLRVIVRDCILPLKLDFAIFDVTCLTKIHALALAVALSEFDIPFRWAVAYTRPENYLNIGTTKAIPGWSDVITAPLADEATLANEGRSIGLIILGHEADRLYVALTEMEPAGGIIYVVDSPKRPDLRYMSVRRNMKVIRQLTRMRSSEWERKTIRLLDVDTFKNDIKRKIDMAKKYASPVILFPYGPKSLVFLSAMQLYHFYPQASWFVYPVPTGYDANYTEGIDYTIWIVPKS